MIYRKIFQDPRWIELCRTTYENIISDNIITEVEWKYLFDLHFSLTGEENPLRDKVLDDIKTIAYTKIKLKT